MSDPYERAKAGRLAFKGGVLATRTKSINKKKKKTKKNENLPDEAAEFISDEVVAAASGGEEGSAADKGEGGEMVYTIDAAKRMKYEQLFPVEAKKFRYDPKFSSKTVEDALDDRVKKKADRYCK
ncbi:uncharacterized protein LOC132293653 [Cornus florida]|uniref:uncharacterized protein LOC132293653 n=1 Tax=Cornus florida TaxID=4283 RepID=UPI00289C9C88|nr:uncharacterized protein LOC132293653 [Cornus florida]